MVHTTHGAAKTRIGSRRCGHVFQGGEAGGGEAVSDPLSSRAGAMRPEGPRGTHTRSTSRSLGSLPLPLGMTWGLFDHGHQSRDAHDFRRVYSSPVPETTFVCPRCLFRGAAAARD